MKIKIEIEVNNAAAMKYILESVASAVFQGDAPSVTITGEQEE